MMFWLLEKSQEKNQSFSGKGWPANVTQFTEKSHNPSALVMNIIFRRDPN